MNTLWIVVIAAVVIYVAYNFYAKYIDRNIVKTDAKKATPAKMYMDGVDFMPTNRNVLYGYHFKSVAAAGPIVGVITAAALWGWLPALLWLMVGVSLIGWVSDYSAIIVSVRNDGNSLSAISHKLIAPRTRPILFTFIFFYLLLVASAFMGLMAAYMSTRPDVPLGIIALGVMGFLAGQMLYKWKMDLILVTAIVVIVTLAAMIFGPVGLNANTQGALDFSKGPISSIFVGINNAVDSGTPNGLFTTSDPTGSLDPRTGTALLDKATGLIKTMPSYLMWALFLLVFSYLAATQPIWRFAQPVNYIGFWVTLLAVAFSAFGAVLAPFIKPAVGAFALAPVKTLGFEYDPGKAWQPLWPMLFVTIACGAISGWHALIGSIGTARQLEYETDALPVGGGAMFTENTLALLSLVAVSIAGTGGGGTRFAGGIGSLLTVIFGDGVKLYGTALGFGVFVIIVLTVTQLIFRVMRVTLSEWVGEAIPVVKNMHISTVISMLLTIALVLTGTWVYLWQLFGASNQLMAALSLLIVTVWLKQQKKNPAFALWPTIFMYLTTLAATIVTARNLLVTIVPKGGIAAVGAWAMILIAILLFVSALFIGWDGYVAYQRFAKDTSSTKKKPAGAAAD